MNRRFSTVFIFVLLVVISCGLPPTLEVPEDTITESPELEATVTEVIPSATPQSLPLSTSTTEVPVIIVPTITNTKIPVTPTPQPTEEPRYVLQPGTPLGTINFLYPDKACDWMGIGGQAFDPNGEPISGLLVEVGGKLNGNDISHLAITGGVAVLGPGGYTVALAEQPIESDGTLWLQLLDQDGSPLSNKIYFSTFAECERNLVLINLSERYSLLKPQIVLPFLLNNSPVDN